MLAADSVVEHLANTRQNAILATSVKNATGPEALFATDVGAEDRQEAQPIVDERQPEASTCLAELVP